MRNERRKSVLPVVAFVVLPLETALRPSCEEETCPLLLSLVSCPSSLREKRARSCANATTFRPFRPVCAPTPDSFDNITKTLRITGKDPSCVAKIEAVYREIDVEKDFKEYENESYKRL